MKWNPTHGRVQPFGLAGVGFDLQTDYPSRTSSVRAMIPLGLGVQVPTSRRGDGFLEGLTYVLLRSAITRDVPLLLGFQLGF